MTPLFLLASGMLVLLQAEPVPSSQSLSPAGEPGCTLEAHAYCRLTGQVSAETAGARLGDAPETYWIEDGLLFVAARRSASPIRLCCAIQTELEHLGDGIWGTSYELRRLDEAFIDVWPLPPSRESGTSWPDRPVYRGSGAPPAPDQVEPLRGSVTRFEQASDALGKARPLTIYTPPSASDEPLAVVYVADGGNVHAYAPIAEAMANACETRLVVLVGLWNEQDADPNLASRLRADDYLWGRDDARFLAHERFLVDEVMPMVEARFGASNRPQDRMLSGNSNGAAWAVSMALRHPDLFHTASAASLGWERALDAADTVSDQLSFHISAGLFEPNFLPDSEAAVRTLADAGAKARMTTYVSGHSPLAFELQFAHALKTTFPASADCVRFDAEPVSD